MEHQSYQNPPIPAGFTAAGGSWDTGFIIRRETDGSELVWVPVLALEDSGTLAGKAQPFGTRAYGYSGGVKAELPDALRLQADSVEQYGGFYLTRYCLSRGKDGGLHSVAGAMPLTNINQFDAERAARTFASGEGIASHLPYAAEMDSALAWLVQNGVKSVEDITSAVTVRNTRAHQDTVTATGSEAERYALGFYDLAGTVDEWTQELTDGAFLWGCNPCAWPTTSRCYFAPYACYTYTGLRAALYLA